MNDSERPTRPASRWKATWLVAVFVSVLFAGRSYGTVNVYFSTATPTLQSDFLASATNQYDAIIVPSQYFPGTYSLTVKGKNPNYNPPSPSTPSVNAAMLLDALVRISTSTYLYGWADGEDYARDVDMGRISYYILHCQNPTVFGASTTTWNMGVCEASLMAAEQDIYDISNSTPTVVPGF